MESDPKLAVNRLLYAVIKTLIEIEESKMKHEEEKDNVVPFQLVLGSKGTGNWLRAMEPQTRFISRPYKSSFFCEEYMVGSHTEFCTYLLQFPIEEERLVHTADFSRDNQWLETIS